MTTNQAGGFRVTNDRKPDGSFPLVSGRGWQVSPTCLVGATGGKGGQNGLFRATRPKWPGTDPVGLPQRVFMRLGEGKPGFGVSRETLKRA